MIFRCLFNVTLRFFIYLFIFLSVISSIFDFPSYCTYIMLHYYNSIIILTYIVVFLIFFLSIDSLSIPRYTLTRTIFLNIISTYIISVYINMNWEHESHTVLPLLKELMANGLRLWLYR